MDNLNILFSDDFRRTVEENLDRDPLRIALDAKIPNAATVASQVKYLRRAERKLPSYYAARCILPSLAFEQSSSEPSASARAHRLTPASQPQAGAEQRQEVTSAARKDYSGKLAIDLTCGLGVDSFMLAGKFERVVSIERDATLAAIARENFRRLGAHNIEVVNTSAEDYLSDADTRADLVYADPDRRSAEGKKMVRIEDCSPDIVALMPLIRRIAPRFVVKLSPLFDVDELFRIFGRNTHVETAFAEHPAVRVEVVSLGGECKEIIAEVSAGSENAPDTRAIRAVAIGLGEVQYPFDRNRSTSNAPAHDFAPETYRYLVIPDVALQKARLARRYLSERGVYIDSDNGYGFAAAEPQNIIGRSIEIAAIEPFDPKSLKRRLKEQGIRGIDILRREFPLTAAEIARALGIREEAKTGTKTGSKPRPAIAFTRAADRLWQIYLENL